MKLVNIGCGGHFHSDWINLDLNDSEFVKHHNIKNKLPFEKDSIDVIYHSHVLEHLTKKEGQEFIKECFRVLKQEGIMRVCIPDLESICREYLINLEKAYTNEEENSIKKYSWNKLEIFDQIIRQKSGGDMIEFIKNGFVNKEYIIERNGDEMTDILNGQTTKKEDWVLIKILKKIYKKIPQSKNNPQKSGESHKWMYDKLDLKILLNEVGFKNFEITTFNTSKIHGWEKYKLDTSKNGTFPRKPDSLIIEVNK